MARNRLEGLAQHHQVDDDPAEGLDHHGRAGEDTDGRDIAIADREVGGTAQVEYVVFQVLLAIVRRIVETRGLQESGIDEVKEPESQHDAGG